MAVNLGKLVFQCVFFPKFATSLPISAIVVSNIIANFAPSKREKPYRIAMQALNTIYNMVCENPQGVGFHIDYIPEFFDHDTMDNSLSHVHTFYEIIWFREAGGVHTIDFQDYEVKKNTIFFLSPGQVHHFDGTTRHKGILLKFCNDFLKEEKADEDLFIKYNMFNAFDSEPFCVIDEEIVPTLENLIHLMEDEQKKESEFAHLDMLRSIVKMFLINISRHSMRRDANSLNETKPSHRLFVRFRRSLEQEYRRLHTVKEYADLLNVSTKTLSNCVTECSGKSALNFINDRVVLEAKRLMRFSNMMIKETAYYLGFEDPSYFVKFFKRCTGFLPSDFRENEKSADLATKKKAKNQSCDL